jgi:hypothetical protein
MSYVFPPAYTAPAVFPPSQVRAKITVPIPTSLYLGVYDPETNRYYLHNPQTLERQETTVEALRQAGIQKIYLVTDAQARKALYNANGSKRKRTGRRKSSAKKSMKKSAKKSSKKSMRKHSCKGPGRPAGPGRPKRGSVRKSSAGRCKASRK